jgi:hypothetical protein
MRLKLYGRFFSIVFVVATLLGVLHHHNDLKSHSDCQICTVQVNLSNGDTPNNTISIPIIRKISSATICELSNLHTNNKFSILRTRAPPKIS